MADISEKELQCLLDYFVEQVALEALIALRNIIILLKSMLDIYLLLNIAPRIDREIEALFMKLNFSGPLSELNKVLGYANELRDLLPPDKIAQCVGVNKLLNEIDKGVAVTLGIGSFANDYMNRYKLASKMENYRIELFDVALEYLDVLLAYVDQAIALKGQESG